MKEEGMTVRELSKELDVTKQALHKRISQLPTELTPKKVGGAYMLTPDIVEYIKEEMNIVDSPSQSDSQSVDSEVDKEVDALNKLVDELKAEKERLYGQIDKKDDQITQLQKLVDQQQQLTLYSNEQSKRLQLELETLEEEKEKEEETEQETEEGKKWWQLFK